MSRLYHQECGYIALIAIRDITKRKVSDEEIMEEYSFYASKRERGIIFFGWTIAKMSLFPYLTEKEEALFEIIYTGDHIEIIKQVVKK